MAPRPDDITGELPDGGVRRAGLVNTISRQVFERRRIPPQGLPPQIARIIEAIARDIAARELCVPETVGDSEAA